MCADRRVSWADMKSDREKSLFAAIQVFSDMAHIFLRADALLIYPHHITALSFLDKIFRKQIFENRTLVAYIPVSYGSTNDDHAFPSLHIFQNNYGHAELLHFLHESVERALEERLSTALSVLTSTSCDVHKYFGHSMIAFCIADIRRLNICSPYKNEI